MEGGKRFKAESEMRASEQWGNKSRSRLTENRRYRKNNKTATMRDLKEEIKSKGDLEGTNK